MRLLAPIAYQQRAGHRIPIQAAFRLDDDGRLGFSIGFYDHHLPLVIDPVVSYTQIIGVNNSTTVNGMQVDSSGNVYIVGGTLANNYPVVGGQSGVDGGEEVYVTKLDPTGKILFSTYIPASDFNSASAIALDPAGNVYVAGVTGTSSFPTTSQNLGTCSSVCNTGFAAKFSPTGTMVYSTLLGSGQQLPTSIVADAAGELYIAGLTADSGLQAVNGFLSTYAGGVCTSCAGPFFGKLNATGNAWVFSSYFSTAGNSAIEALASGIALDTSGNVYIAGPGNTVPLQNWFENGVGEYFVAEFSPDGRSLLFSTLLGGNSSSQYDTLAPIQVGSDGTIYLAGSEYATDFPYSTNAFLLPVGQANLPRLFALAINPAHSGLTYSTSLGSGYANVSALDSKGDLYIGGSYYNASLPFKNSLAHDSAYSGFVAEIDPSGALLSATGFGGRNTSQPPTGLAVDNVGDIYVAGAPVDSAITNATLDPINVGTGKTYSAQAALGTTTSFIGYSTFIAKIIPANQPQISLSYENPFLELRDAGSADLHISSLEVSGGFASANSTCGSTVPAGTSCFLTPTDSSGGAAIGNITINSDALPASQSFTPSPVPTTTGPIGGNLIVDASQLIFPPQQTGTTSPARPLTLTNTGTASLTINSILTFDEFAETNNCGVLAPQASCTAQITVSPTASGAGSSNVGVVYNTNLRTDVYAYFAPNPTTGPLLVSTPNISFGGLFPGQQSLPRSVTITNTSNSTTAVDTPTITGPNASSFSIGANTCVGVSLQSQQSCAVSVVYQAPTSGAPVLATLNITDGAAAVDTVSLYGSIITQPTITITPGPFSFGALTVGQSVQQVFHITNTGSANETLSNIYILLANSIAPSEYGLQNSCTNPLSPSDSCTVAVTFTPSTVGTYNAVLSISINGGVAVQTLPIPANVVVPFSVSPSNLTFSSTIVGSAAAAQSITITNNLSTAINSPALAITGPNAGDFSQTTSCPASLAGGAMCTANITFKPSTSSVETATLTLTSSTGNTTQTVALSGTGLSPDFSITASPSSVTITAGQVAAYNFSAAPSAGFAGNVTLGCSGLPAFATCSFSPASVAIMGGTTSTSVLSVATASQASLSHDTSIQFAVALFGSMMVLVLPGRRRKVLARIFCSLLFASTGLLLVSASGCSGGSAPPASEAGTYTVTVTAVSGTLAHMSTVTLIIQ
ncbi:MAG TPA: choice-of-anchor D domain-containing protein [Acidobacteriaceae bacterium]|nr:choice-of-anchor D domain-containing protein [Acidobacteriaceae bacterium]